MLLYVNMLILYLKRQLQFQVALVVYLSHIGSFIPADSATIGITDRFYAIQAHDV